jgi:predicted PurR-regulated permease PerM
MNDETAEPTVEAPSVVPTPSPPPAPPVAVVEDRRPFIALLLAALVIFWAARSVLGPFIVAAVGAYAFSPLVSAAERRFGLSRIVDVAIGYGVTLVLIGIALFLLAGRVISEAQLLASSGPESLAALLRQLVGGEFVTVGNERIAVADVARQVQGAIAGFVASPGDAIHVAESVGELALQAVLALIVMFYFLIDGPSLRDATVRVLPLQHQEKTSALLGRIHDVLGRWLRGQLVLIALVALVVYIFLGPILHLPYALAIAILTGFLEIIPLVGPLVATAIAAIDAFARGGPNVAAIVIIGYFVLRQIEDQVVAPVVIGRAVHLHPVITIFAVLVGLSVYGVLGGLLGVPIAAALNVIYRELYVLPAQATTPASPTEAPSARPATDIDGR